MLSHVALTPEEQRFRQRGVMLTRRLGFSPEHLARTMAMGPSSFPIQGEDRSSYQAPGFNGQFSIAKVSEWPTYIDPNFAANRKMAHDAGLPFGIYPFTHFTSSSALQEFELMMNGRPGYRAGVGQFLPNEWVMVDNEVSWNEGAMCAFADLCRQHGCRYVTLYSYMGMFAAHDTSQAVHHFDDPHIAAYGSQVPGGDRWASITPWWQFTDHDALGIDRNCFTPSANIADLLRRINGSAPVPPPAPPPLPPARILDNGLAVVLNSVGVHHG